MTCGASYTRYHAKCLAEAKSAAEIAAEIERVDHKANTHQFQWNEVGNRSDTWVRADVLREILSLRLHEC